MSKRTTKQRRAARRRNVQARGSRLLYFFKALGAYCDARPASRVLHPEVMRDAGPDLAAMSTALKMLHGPQSPFINIVRDI